MNFAKVIGFVLVSAVGMACSPISVGKELARLDQKQADRDECKRLESNPDALQTSDVQYYDEGIINDYRQLSAVTIRNPKQHCAVIGARGIAMWRDANGHIIGSTTFSLGKSIPAGATVDFSTSNRTLLNSTTIKSSASRVTIAFTTADVIYTG
jgi:hypothetical protein